METLEKTHSRTLALSHSRTLALSHSRTTVGALFPGRADLRSASSLHSDSRRRPQRVPTVRPTCPNAFFGQPPSHLPCPDAFLRPPASHRRPPNAIFDRRLHPGSRTLLADWDDARRADNYRLRAKVKATGVQVFNEIVQDSDGILTCPPSPLAPS